MSVVITAMSWAVLMIIASATLPIYRSDRRSFDVFDVQGQVLASEPIIFSFFWKNVTPYQVTHRRKGKICWPVRSGAAPGKLLGRCFWTATISLNWASPWGRPVRSGIEQTEGKKKFGKYLTTVKSRRERLKARRPPGTGRISPQWSYKSLSSIGVPKDNVQFWGVILHFCGSVWRTLARSSRPGPPVQSTLVHAHQTGLAVHFKCQHLVTGTANM